MIKDFLENKDGEEVTNDRSGLSSRVVPFGNGERRVLQNEKNRRANFAYKVSLNSLKFGARFGNGISAILLPFSSDGDDIGCRIRHIQKRDSTI